MSFLINPFTFAVAGGDFESIATVTVGSGGAANIEFTSIPSTFAHLQIRLIGSDGKTTGVASRANITVNGDTGSNYSRHELYGDGSSVGAGGVASGSLIEAAIGRSGAGYYFGAAVIDILDYANTAKNSTFRSLSGVDNNGNGAIWLHSGCWLSTSAITSIKLSAGVSNFAQHSTAALYGIKAP
jgi:hypothetical protein